MSDEEKEGPLDPRWIDAWKDVDVVSPPSGFAERVLAEVRPHAKPRRRAWLVGGGVSAFALAAAMLLRFSGAVAQGEAIAKDRMEVAVGGRARAVLEPGAVVSWKGDDVVQSRGDVFYRVEPGARFRVLTPAGEVEVKGTCFGVKVSDMQKRDVKVGAIGATLATAAFVAVYEGRVAVSHASERVDVGAGESASIGVDGAKRLGSVAEGQRSFEAASDESVAKANESLVAQVSGYRQRLEAIGAEKTTLETKLKAAEATIARQDGGDRFSNLDRNFDLTKDDWAELARRGEMKYRTPCLRTDRFEFSAEKLNKLGLAPTDGPAIRDAYEHSYQRVWSTIKPMCVQAVGAPASVIDTIGPESCIQLIYELAAKQDRASANAAMLAVSEIRGGLRPEPAADKVAPVTKMYMLLTGENAAFEADLAKSFGPQEAHRLAHADEMCAGEHAHSNIGKE